MTAQQPTKEEIWSELDRERFIKAAKLWACGDTSRATMESLTDASRDDEPVGRCVARILAQALASAERDAERLDWLEQAGKGHLSPLWAQDWLKIRSAIDAAQAAQRKDGAT